MTRANVECTSKEKTLMKARPEILIDGDVGNGEKHLDGGSLGRI